MTSLHSRRQQAKRRDDRKIDIVLHGRELRLGLLIQSRNCILVAGIDLLDLRVFVNDLRLVVAHLVDLVRDFVEVFASNDDANQFFATEPHPITLNRFARPFLI